MIEHVKTAAGNKVRFLAAAEADVRIRMERRVIGQTGLVAVRIVRFGSDVLGKNWMIGRERRVMISTMPRPVRSSDLFTPLMTPVVQPSIGPSHTLTCSTVARASPKRTISVVFRIPRPIFSSGPRQPDVKAATKAAKASSERVFRINDSVLKLPYAEKFLM